MEAVEREKPDILGLSGLITPSLDEMAHVASEMERLGMEIPLLIGGATTSRVHTAVKIAPVYSGPVVQVLDASRSVPIAGNLLNPAKREAFTEELKAEQAQMRKNHEERGAAATFLTLDEARANRLATDWSKSVVPAPLNPGVTVLEGVTIAALRPYIDWTPFFLTWEMHGRYPNIFDDPKVGAEAKTLFNDAEALLNRIENEQLLGVRGVAGLFPANSTGDDIEVYGDESRTAPLCTLHTLRQQKPQPEGKPNLALSDFIAPKESGVKDYIGDLPSPQDSASRTYSTHSRKSTTTTTASWPRHLLTGSPKPSQKCFTKKSVVNSGAMRPEKYSEQGNSSPKSIRASARHPAIQPAPTTLKKQRSSTCSMPKQTPV